MNRIEDRTGPTRRTFVMGLAAVAGALVLTACGSATTTSGSGAAATQPSAQSASAPAAATSAAPAASPAAGGVTQKVNANSASVADMQKAFEAAGISNAARWAHEVEEYRPYPTDDPSFGKLRRELAKYNPGPGVVDQIVATLSL